MIHACAAWAMTCRARDVPDASHEQRPALSTRAAMAEKEAPGEAGQPP